MVEEKREEREVRRGDNGRDTGKRKQVDEQEEE